MPRVDYNGKIVEFPDGMSQDDMRTALEGLSQPKAKAFDYGTSDKPRIVPAIDTSTPLHFPPDVEAAPGPAPAARKTLGQARMFGITPVMASGAAADLAEYDKQQRLGTLGGLPALRQYAEQSAHHATAVSDDLDNLGVLDWTFGRPYKEPVPKEAVGPYAEYLRAQGGAPDATPGWLLSYGRYAYNFLSNMKVFKQIKFDGAVDMEAQKQREDIGGTQLPGEDKPVGKLLYGAQDLVQGTAPYVLNPAIAFGTMYAEGTAQTYLTLRQHGYGHEDAAEIGEIAGFSSAVVGSLAGARLFGSLLPKSMVRTVMDAVPGALQRAFYDSPALWKFLRDVGINQLHATAMNVGMAVTNAAVVEAYDAHLRKHPLHLSVFTDTINRAAMDSLKLLPLSIYAGMRQAGQRSMLFKAGEGFREGQKGVAESMDVEQRIYDEYEKQGHALRSLKAAADIDAAVQAIQNSKFFKDSPEEGKRLLQQVLHPRKSQSVFLDPEYLAGMPPEQRDALHARNFDEAMVTGAPVEAPLADFLTHPAAPALTKSVAAGADLLTAREALSRAQPPDFEPEFHRLFAEEERVKREMPEGPERRAQLQDIERQMREFAVRSPVRPADQRGMGVGIAEGPVPELRLEPEQAVRVSEMRGRPAPPMLGFRGNLTKERLSAWAQSEVEGRTIGSFDSLRDLHRQNASSAERRAAQLQESATGALGRSTRKAQKGISAGVEGAEAGQEGARGALEETHTRGAVENLIDRSQRWVRKAEDKGVGAVKEEVKAGDKLAQVARLEKIQKVNEAMRDAVERAKKEAAGIQQAVSDAGKSDARKQAYAAGWEFGAAHDAVLAALGGEPRGWEAPDVSDLWEGLRKAGLSDVIDFDPKAVNKLLQEPRSLDDMTLPEAREVRRFLKNLDDLTYAVTKIRAENRLQDVEALRGKVIDHLEKIPFAPRGQDARLTSKSALTLRERWGAGKAKLQAEFNQPYTIFGKMGPVGDSLWFDGFVPARNREEMLHDRFMPDFKAISDAMPEEIRKIAKEVVPSLPGSPGKWGLRTRDEVWRLILHLGTESGINEISKSLGVSPANLMQWAQQNIAETPEQRRAVMENFIQPMWKIFNKLWQEYEPALQNRGLPPPKKLDAAPFVLDGQTYSGGYGGRLRWSGEGWEHAVDPNSVAALFGLDYYGPSTAQAHLKERTGPQGGVFPDLDFHGIGSSLRSEIHDLAFHGFVENVHRLLSPGEFRDTLANKIGKQFVEQLYDPNNRTSWLHVVAQGRIPDLHTLSATGLISNLQGRAAISAFALNLRVVAMQTSHVPAMAAGMGLNPLWSVRSFNGERKAWAESVSQVLSYRQNDFERHNTELLGQLTGVRPGEGLLAENVPGMGALQNGLNRFNWAIWKEMDGRLSHALWEMGLEKGLRKGLGQEEAIREADKAVQRGMPVQTIYEQSAFVRDRKMLGLMFLVRNFPNTLYNVQALQSWDARARGGSAAGSIAASSVMSGARYIGMVLAAEVIGKGLFGGHLPKDDEPLDEWVAANAARAVAYPVMLDSPAEYMARKVYDDDYAAKRALDQLSPPGIETGKRALEDLGKAAAGDDEKGIRAAMEALGIATRLPIPRLYDWARALFESDTPIEATGRGAGYLRGE